MNTHSDKRRKFVKAGLALPFVVSTPWQVSGAKAQHMESFPLPDNVRHELIRLYGDQANYVLSTDKIELKVPMYAENGAVVPVSVTGEQGLVSSMAIFVAVNPQPLAGTCRFYAGSDLTLATRVRMMKSSDFYVVAQTRHGLLGVRKFVKLTVGCGGG